MNESEFWDKMSDEYLKEHPEAPPLTGELLAVFESRVGLKLPQSLTTLLRIKNGGPLKNTEFRFAGRLFQVTYIKAVTNDDSYESIRSYASILDDPDDEESQEQAEKLKKKVGDLAKVLYVAEPLDYPYGFALNYNQLNRTGEPTVLRITLECGEDPRADVVADSFAEFLTGQYFGDERSIVDLKEAEKYHLIAEGGYEGRYRGVHEEGSNTLSGLPVKVRWKVCSHRRHLIVFQETDWAGRIEIAREEIPKSALAFDFPDLESYGVELESELAEMIRPAIEIEVLSKFDADLMPDCYQLLLHIQPGEKRWVSIKESSPFQGRWKNRESKVAYSSLKSASKLELAKVLRAVAGSCSGLRRWLT